MLNYDLAQLIDSNNQDLEFKGVPSISFVNCLDQLNLQGINETDKLIHLRPELFLDETHYMGEHDSAKIKVNKAKSKVDVNIQSLITKNNHTFNSEDKTKIKTPFANKRIFCAGQLINRKFKQGISFVPKIDEGVRFNSEEYKELRDNNEYNSHMRFEVIKLLDMPFEKLEYSQNHNVDYSNDLCIFKEDVDKPSSDYTLSNYVIDKYVVYPYKVTETWQLAFDVDIDEIDVDKDTSLGSTINISYYLCVLGYSENYLKSKISKEKVLFEHANLEKDLMFSNLDITELGKVYKDDLMTYFNVYTETVSSDEFTIAQSSKITPVVHENPNDYDLEIEYNDNLLFKEPKVISMLPILDK
ncbi:hypothetical protein O3668_11505 [Staphylococcus capitis]|uniref:hypothetical protein n=3 Tax=Staphylococcus capitis TaxID=29388 RepID=UPI00352D87B1